MLESGGGGHVSVLHRLHIRGWTMLPLTLISIKPFLWNIVPHRSRLPTCLFAVSRWCRILAEWAASETRSGPFKACLRPGAWMSLHLTSDLLRAWWCKSMKQSCFIIQPTSFGCFPSIGSKMFFQCYVIVCRPSRVSPLWIIPALIGRKSIHGTSLAHRITVPWRNNCKG